MRKLIGLALVATALAGAAALDTSPAIASSR
jgi:hypothetical protein